jgi:hypothetical protein
VVKLFLKQPYPYLIFGPPTYIFTSNDLFIVF